MFSEKGFIEYAFFSECERLRHYDYKIYEKFILSEWSHLGHRLEISIIFKDRGNDFINGLYDIDFVDYNPSRLRQIASILSNFEYKMFYLDEIKVRFQHILIRCIQEKKQEAAKEVPKEAPKEVKKRKEIKKVKKPDLSFVVEVADSDQEQNALDITMPEIQPSI